MEELLLTETEKGVSGVSALVFGGRGEHTGKTGKKGKWQKKT